MTPIGSVVGSKAVNESVMILLEMTPLAQLIPGKPVSVLPPGSQKFFVALDRL